MKKLLKWSYDASFYLKNQYNYSKIQYEDIEKIKKLQLKKLTHILNVATTTVPFYRPYRKEFNFEKITLDDLKKLPVITKAQIKKAPELFYNKDAHHFDYWQSSGSTGEPLRFRIPHHLKLIDRMIFLRTMSNGNFKMSARSPLIMLSSYCPAEGEAIYKKFGPFKNVWRLSPFHVNVQTVSQYVELIIKSKTSVLTGYPSSIYLFTLQLMQQGIRIPSIKVIKTASEMLLPEYRETIVNWWKLPVLDWYGQAEMTALAIQCPYGQYHNQDDYGLCEINEKNELILTSLNNDVMPFIRYQSGDLADPIDSTRLKPCQCGRRFSIPFSRVLGRSDDLVHKLDGTKITAVNFCTFLSKVPGIRQYKIVQHANYSIELFLVPEKNFNLHEFVITGIKDRAGDISVIISEVSFIPRNNKTMKQKIIESHVL